jgi:hypothetical protein
MTAQLAKKHAVKAVKVVVKRHSKAVRIVFFVTIVVFIVVTHESSISLVAIGYKALEMFGDVVADRVFPATWFDDDK